MADELVLELKGLDDLRDILKRAGTEGQRLFASALWKEANRMLRDSVENYVPVRDGILRGSAVISPDRSGSNASSRRIEVRFGYGGAASAYALAVHENPRAGRTGGVSPSGHPYRKWAQIGQYKYLERPVLNGWATAAPRMALDMGRIFE